MLVREIMTAAVVTAEPETEVREVAALMRDRNVGSVVIRDHDRTPVAIVTDRDLTVRVTADEQSAAQPISAYISQPLVTGEPEMALEEAAALMVQHRVRRLPVVD